MRQWFDNAGSQAQKLAMLRRYGWGVPDLSRALLSAADDATLMIEDALLPFRKDGPVVKTRDMNLHRLPWPREELASLGALNVELRITLSYFIEPNPGERGWTRRHRYSSHNLRFVVKSSLETLPAFRQRINKAAEAEETGQAIVGAADAAGGDDWILGPIRDRGSIHSDIWRGSAAALAERDGDWRVSDQRMVEGKTCNAAVGSFSPICVARLDPGSWRRSRYLYRHQQ